MTAKSLDRSHPCPKSSNAHRSMPATINHPWVRQKSKVIRWDLLQSNIFTPHIRNIGMSLCPRQRKRARQDHHTARTEAETICSMRGKSLQLLQLHKIRGEPYLSREVQVQRPRIHQVAEDCMRSIWKPCWVVESRASQSKRFETLRLCWGDEINKEHQQACSWKERKKMTYGAVRSRAPSSANMSSLSKRAPTAAFETEV